MQPSNLDVEALILAEYTKSIARENSKAWEMMQTATNMAGEWDAGKMNRWIGYAQCLLVAEGGTTIDELRNDVGKIVKREC